MCAALRLGTEVRGIMVSTVLLLLLLVSAASASHNYGGKATYHYLGKNHDGTLRVNFRNKQTFDGCHHSHSWYCTSGYCGRETNVERGTIDSSTNAPSYNRQWCESETITTRIIPSDRPFQMRAASCCWVSTRTHLSTWTLLASVDLGTRSDTAKPNRPPLVSGLSFIRVPQNCPRTYNLLSFDPDGDRVRCRFGNKQQNECTTCHTHSGFVLDQDTCTLQYRNTYSDQRRVLGFEMVVEDFPQSHITLTYSDGSQSYKFPLSNRWRRQLNTTQWWNFTSVAPTMAATRPPGWWARYTTPNRNTAWTPWWGTTSTAPTTNTNTPPWWWTRSMTPNGNTTWTPWWGTTSTAPTTNTTRPPWWWTRSTTPNRTTAWSLWWWTSSSTHTTTEATTPWRRTRSTSPPTTTVLTTTPPSSNSPLSKFPLQFSFLVDPPVPSCQEGKFLPRLLYPTPHNDAVFRAEVNKEMEFRVRAEAEYSRINDILISGPLNISKHRNTRGEFVIRWTPTQDELEDNFPICFAVESITSPGSNNYSQPGIYHSEMRCVRVEVVEEHVKADVICRESMMKVEVEKTDYFGNHEDHFQLNNGANTVCEIQSNSTHIYVDVPLNACGTLIEEDEDYLYFKNEITTVDNTSALITRRHQLEVQFYCQYPKHGNVTLGFTAHRNNVTVMEKGFGTFTYQFEFYPDSYFRTMINPSLYPLEFDIGSDIFMQIEATSTVNNTSLFVESCSAAPYDIPNYTPTYSIFENGCKMDPTIRTYSTNHSRQFRFSMEAFKFIGLHDQVYISCSVMMCEAGNSNTRCAQGCQRSTPRRWKREAVSQSSLHFISQGPLRLRRSTELNEGSGMNLNLNLVFIAGCLLAAVAIASALFIYRAKMSAVKYQPLPTYET